MAVIKKFRIKKFKEGKSLISLKKISMRFTKNHQILDNINLEIPKGQVLGLLGPNGAGKSTLMNIISGLIKPNYGSLIIKGDNITDLPIHERAKNIKFQSSLNMEVCSHHLVVKKI